MAIFCLPINYLFDNSNFTRAHIARLVEHFHGKGEVIGSILIVAPLLKNLIFNKLKYVILIYSKYLI